jgi:hypothetical protein
MQPRSARFLGGFAAYASKKAVQARLPGFSIAIFWCQVNGTFLDTL